MPKLKLLSKIYLSQAYFRKGEVKSENKFIYQNLAREYTPGMDEIAEQGSIIKTENIFLPNIVSDSYLKPLKQTDKKRYLEELTSLCIIEPDRYEGLMIEFKQIYPDENFDVFLTPRFSNFFQK
jgi:hypothetical protein